MERAEYLDLFFGKSHQPVEAYHSQFVKHGIPMHRNTVSQVRGGHTSGNEEIFQRLLAKQSRDRNVSLKDQLYARIAATGMAVRQSPPKYPDKFLTNGFTEAIAEERKIHHTRNAVEALQAMSTEYLLETPEDEPTFQVEVHRYLTAQMHPPSFRSAQIWSAFESEWNGTRTDFFQFLNQTGKFEPAGGKKPSGRLSASWTPIGVSVLGAFYLTRLADTIRGNVAPTRLDTMLTEDYEKHQMVTQEVVDEICRLVPVRFNQEMGRTHLMAIATGNVNDRINYK